MVRLVKQTATLPVVLFLACSSIQVDSHVNPEASLSGLTTYSWLLAADSTGSGAMLTNPLMRQRIISAADRELAAKGYQRVTADSDLLVALHAVSDRVVSPMKLCGDWGLYCGFEASQPVDLDYTQGTLVLAVAQADERTVAWMGWAQDAIDRTSPESTAKKVDEAVVKILADLPSAQ
jgi:hypothetical protein